MEPAPRRIDLIESAFSGGLAGLLLFVVFDICMVASDLTLDVDPVAYFLTGVAMSILGGIVLSLVLTWLWNRRVSNGARGKGRQESE
jgi:NhaP-type Na+/H+ or K+/H+ antiporter